MPRRMLALARSTVFHFATVGAFLALVLWSGSVVLSAPAAFAQDEDQVGAADSEGPAKDQGDAADGGRIAEDQVDATDRERLAKEFSDPLTTLPQIFLQDAYTPANHGTGAQANRVIVRAIIPRIPRFTLLPFVQLVRPSFFLVTVPTGKGDDTRTEFGDMQLFDLAVLPWPKRESGLMIGIGPTFTFPTATYKTAGQGAWQVGPAFGAIYKGIPWLLAGALIQNPISFAYTIHDHQPLSTLLFQPVLLVALPGGWYMKSADATWTYSWRQGKPRLLPLSFGIGRVLLRDGLPPINFFVSGEWMAYRQDAAVAPQTTVRFGLTVAFPGFRPWR